MCICVLDVFTTCLPTIYVNYICSLPSFHRLKTQFLSFTIHDLRQKSVTVMVIGNGDDDKDDGDDDT